MLLLLHTMNFEEDFEFYNSPSYASPAPSPFFPPRGNETERLARLFQCRVYDNVSTCSPPSFFCAYTHTHAHLHLHPYAFTSLCACVPIYVSVCLSVCFCVCVRVCAQIHVCIFFCIRVGQKPLEWPSLWTYYCFLSLFWWILAVTHEGEGEAIERRVKRRRERD